MCKEGEGEGRGKIAREKERNEEQTRHTHTTPGSLLYTEVYRIRTARARARIHDTRGRRSYSRHNGFVGLNGCWSRTTFPTLATV